MRDGGSAVGSLLSDPFVGRDAQLGVLDAALTTALAGTAAVVLVVGEAGIGKTRLLDEVWSVARRRGFRVVRGEADESERSPFAMWAGVERNLGLGADRIDPALPSSERRWELLEQLGEAIVAAAPVLMVLEDLHWADELSVWVLERLPRLLDAPGTVIVATSRPDEPDAPSLTGFRRQAVVVDLAGLELAAVEQLVAARALAPSADAVALHERTAGNPLFVRELLAAGLAVDELPRAVSDVLRRSLDRFDPPVRRTIAACALAGPNTPIPVVAAAIDRPGEDVLCDLDAAAAGDVLEVGASGFVRFRHSLLAEAAAGSLGASDRRMLHLALGDAWEATDPSPAGRAEAALHRVATLPAGDLAAIASDALEVVRDLRSVGDERRGVDVARTAFHGLASAGPPLGDIAARLGVELGAALESIGDQLGATAAFERAAADAASGDDAMLLGTALVGSLRTVGVVLPAPAGAIQRLVDVDARIPPGDLPLRTELLGRLGVLRATAGGHLARAHDDGDAAVAMARRLGRPDLLVASLANRHLVPLGPDGLDAKGRAADEIVALGEHLGRPDLTVQGHEWAFTHRLDLGDRPGAEHALDQLELLAAVLPSPRWRYFAALRRALLMTFDGDRPGALDQYATATAIGRGAVHRIEVAGAEMSGRIATMQLWGVDDPLARILYDELLDAERDLPAPFIRIQMAVGAYVFGEGDRGRATVDRYARDAGRMVGMFEGPRKTAQLGELAADLGLTDHGPALRAALLPFEQRLIVNVASPQLPIAATLGRLALLDGDVSGAVAHHQVAVGLATALSSPPLRACCLARLAEALAVAGDTAPAAAALAEGHTIARRIGLVLPNAPLPADRHPTVTESRPASLRRAGTEWELRTREGAATIIDSLGVAQLGRLLSQPHTDIAAIDLAGMSASVAPVVADLGPALDGRAKREYRRRIVELQADIDEAETNNDLGRTTAAILELDALMNELRRAVGLRGRDRPSGSGAERARVNVTRNVRRAITAIGEQLPAVAAHLENSVHTGRWCSYAPEPAAAIDWHVEPDPN